MKWIKWDELPAEMQNEEVRKYYDILSQKKTEMTLKRAFDVIFSLLLLLILWPVFLIMAVAIKLDSEGPIFYRQERITQYGKCFHIHKFRTMEVNADKGNNLLTSKNDARITRVGKVIRKCRLDEISQLIDVIRGNMTFVGTRPEVAKYVERYSPVMMATLLLPAGITSEACVLFKDEDELLCYAEDIDDAYVKIVLPRKMYYNLKSIEKFGFWNDISAMIKTVGAVLGKHYKADIDGETEFVERLAKKQIAEKK